MIDDPPLKPVIWTGTSLKDRREFPSPVQDHMGYAAVRCAILHAFQKKSKSGRQTPRRDIELIQQRLREAEQIARGGQP